MTTWTDRLPPPSDPNDIFTNHFSNATRLGNALPLLSFLPNGFVIAEDSASMPFVSYAADVDFSLFYDTGFANLAQPFRPSNIALKGSPGDRMSGQYAMEVKTGSVQFDTQSLDFLGLGAVGQFFVDVNFTQDDFGQDKVRLPHLFGRVLSLEGVQASSSIELGTTATAFTDVRSVPKSIIQDVMPVGSISVEDRRNVRQIRLSRKWETGISTVLSVEDHPTSDISVPGTVVKLRRWPAFVARVRYDGANSWDSYQVAALVRPFNVEDAMFREHSATGWGFSGIARIKTASDRTAAFMGAAGGKGIGNYLYGGSIAAVQDAVGFRVVDNAGAFAGIEHRWLLDDDNNPRLWSSAAYGYAYTDTGLGMPGADKKLQQAWSSLIWNVNQSWGIGLEYNYGAREVQSGMHGENHRIQLVLKFGSESANERAPSNGTAHLQRL